MKVEGVKDTVVGYTGGDTDQQPDYDQVCFGRDWVEGVRVVYDDTEISYEKLLDEFFDKQEPAVGSRQYASIIFPHDEAQSEAAQTWLNDARDNNKIRKDGVPASITAIEPLTVFWKAENYHQRYWQKFRPRIAALVGLMAVGSGILDRFILSHTLQTTIHNGANALVLAGCLYVLVERVVDKKTVLL